MSTKKYFNKYIESGHRNKNKELSYENLATQLTLDLDSVKARSLEDKLAAGCQRASYYKS